MAAAALAAFSLAISGTKAEYTIRPLSPDGARTWAHGVNSLGHVAGEWDTPGMTAAFWGDSGLRSLGYLYRPIQYCYVNNAISLNDEDQVVGYQTFRPCLSSTENDTRAFYWALSTSSMVEIAPTSDFKNTNVSKINNTGIVVGTMSIPTGTGPSQRAFRWTSAGGMTLIGTLGGATSTAVSINQAGYVLGQSMIAGDAAMHTYVLKHDGVLTPEDDFGALPAPGALPVDLNDSGQVLFKASVDIGGGNYYDRAVVASNGQFTQLGYLVNYGNVTPLAINSSGDVVGNALAPGYQTLAFLNHGNSFRNLNDLLPPGSGWQLQTAEDINDAGQIVGVGILNGTWRGYIMSPVAPGDVNKDGTVDAADAVLMLQSGAGLLAGVSARLGDVAPSPSADPRGYGDGVVDMLDALRVLRHVSGLESHWP
jgi:probable HAF family extracellular repeat protein